MIRTFAKGAVKEAMRDAAGADEPGDPAAAGRVAEKIAKGAAARESRGNPRTGRRRARRGQRLCGLSGGDCPPYGRP